jgi:hypothetical protein
MSSRGGGGGGGDLNILQPFKRTSEGEERGDGVSGGGKVKRFEEMRRCRKQFPKD